MDLLPQTILDQLAANGRANQDRIATGEDTIDFEPVVKLFTPDAGATWLLTETHPDDRDIAHGLCDLGFGFPEIGAVRLSEIRAVRGRLGLPVERDLHFRADAPLSAYAERARQAGGIFA
jgi:hypothetical protein